MVNHYLTNEATFIVALLLWFLIFFGFSNIRGPKLAWFYTHPTKNYWLVCLNYGKESKEAPIYLGLGVEKKVIDKDVALRNLKILNGQSLGVTEVDEEWTSVDLFNTPQVPEAFEELEIIGFGIWLNHVGDLHLEFEGGEILCALQSRQGTSYGLAELSNLLRTKLQKRLLSVDTDNAAAPGVTTKYYQIIYGESLPLVVWLPQAIKVTRGGSPYQIKFTAVIDVLANVTADRQTNCIFKIWPILRWNYPKIAARQLIEQ